MNVILKREQKIAAAAKKAIASQEIIDIECVMEDIEETIEMLDEENYEDTIGRLQSLSEAMERVKDGIEEFTSSIEEIDAAIKEQA